MRLEGCGQRELALPKGATKGVGTPLRGGGDASSVPIRAEGAKGYGRRGPRPILGGPEHAAPSRNSQGHCGGERDIRPHSPFPRRSSPWLCGVFSKGQRNPAALAVPGAVRPRRARPGRPCPPGPRQAAAGAQPRRRAARGALGAPARPREETRAIYARSAGRCGRGPGLPGAVPPAGPCAPRPLHGHLPLCCRHRLPCPPIGQAPLILRDSLLPSFPRH